MRWNWLPSVILRRRNVAPIAAVAAVAWLGVATSASAQLRVSPHADRTASIPLEGADLQGAVHIFVDPEVAQETTAAVFWRLHGTSPARTEIVKPYDYAGTLGDGLAASTQTHEWAAGPHVLMTALRGSRGNWVLHRTPFSVADQSRLQMSLFPERRAPVAVDSAVVQGSVYIFAEAQPKTRQVAFHLDGSDTPIQRERAAPWDLAGTAPNGLAGTLDTTLLEDGWHSVRAVFRRTGGSRTTRVANFLVANHLAQRNPVLVQLGHINGSDAQIAIADLGGHLEVYVCGGASTLQNLSRWFDPAAPAEVDADGNGFLRVVSENLLLEGLVGTESSSGTLTELDTGEVRTWQAERPAPDDDHAGLYEVRYGSWHFGLIVQPAEVHGRYTALGAGTNALGRVGQVTPIRPVDWRGEPELELGFFSRMRARVDMLSAIVALDFKRFVGSPLHRLTSSALSPF